MKALLCLALVLPTWAEEQTNYLHLKDSPAWERKFTDSGSSDWHDKWFLDGERATATNSPAGMEFCAGKGVKNADHAVLWTKDSFAGDMKIEFTYTRTDSEKRNVNILYIQATGTGTAPYQSDISKWSELRMIPSMRLYFDHMDALHISFAAFAGETGDYLRVRRYPRPPGPDFQETEVPNAYQQLGLFETGESYAVTVIKTDQILYLQAQGSNKTRLFTWDLSQRPPLIDGRLGIRHMFARSSIYKDITISTRPAAVVAPHGKNSE